MSDQLFLLNIAMLDKNDLNRIKIEAVERSDRILRFIYKAFLN